MSEMREDAAPVIIKYCPHCGYMAVGWRLAARRAFDQAEEIAGNRNRLARMIGVTRQAINGWRRIVPVERCPAVEKATGVTCAELRPDHYVKFSALKTKDYKP